jgi:hypothetical protein
MWFQFVTVVPKYLNFADSTVQQMALPDKAAGLGKQRLLCSITGSGKETHHIVPSPVNTRTHCDTFPV